jgi:hypothetical protein
MSLACPLRALSRVTDGNALSDRQHCTFRPTARLGRSSVSAQASAAPLTVDQTFTKTYEQLAGALASPGGLVVAAPTALGRGLVATRAIEQGETLLSGELV